MSNSNILLCTLGVSWFLLPEIYYFVNLERFDFYRFPRGFESIKQKHKNAGIEDTDNLWIITTLGTEEEKQKIIKWWGCIKQPPENLKIFYVQGVFDFIDSDTNSQMHEAILRLVYTANEIKKLPMASCIFHLQAAGRLCPLTFSR
jgi:adenosine deaminase